MKKYKEGALTRRRKISVPELGLGLMTTVQETHMDSRAYIHDGDGMLQLTVISHDPWSFSGPRKVE